MRQNSSSTDQGRRAESEVATYLRRQQFEVLEQNWRTPYCEIDIIAKKAGTVFMVEVKYRSHAYSGDGLDAITSKKLLQMKRAADAWVHLHRYVGNYELLVAAVDLYGAITLISVDD